MARVVGIRLCAYFTGARDKELKKKMVFWVVTRKYRNRWEPKATKKKAQTRSRNRRGVFEGLLLNLRYSFNSFHCHALTLRNAVTNY